jgi:multiple sugar transport system ATP-binding protein
LRYDPEAPAERALALDIMVSEYIGAQSVLLCKCGASKVMVEVNSETPVALGQRLTFAVNPSGIHLFDSRTDIAL